MAKNDITVKILGDAKGFTQAIDSTDSRLGKFGKAAGVVGAGLAGFGVAAIVGLEKLGATFDDAYDSIATTTGATGEALSGLEQSFRDVAESGPHAFEDVATAIGDLNQRLGVTGAPLEGLSDQFLDLARITDTDVSANIEAATEAFSKFGIPADDMSASLDELFRASQASGIGVDVLATQMTRFGTPLQQLGFGFEESAALLAGFEEAGINTQQVMSGMTRGLADMARDGEAPAETFARVTEQIAAMEDPAEATALAVELFGTKAGPELAAAIQSGQFDLTEMLGVIENGEGTISGTADATDDWREKLTTLRNKVLVRLAPLAEKVFAKITEAMVAFSEWLERNWPQIQATLIEVWEWVQRNVLPIVRTVFTGVVRAATGIVNWFRTNWDDIRTTIRDVFVWINDNVVPVVVDIAQAIADAFEWVRTNVVPVVVDIVDGIVNAVTGVVNWFRTNWDTISSIFMGVFNGIKTFIVDGVVPVFEAIINAATGVVNWFRTNWDTISGVASAIIDGGAAVIDWFRDLPGNVSSAFGDGFAWLRDKAQAVRNYISERVQNIVDAVTGIATRTATLFGDGFAWLREKALAVRNYISERVTNIVDSIKGIVTRARTLFGDGFSWLRERALAVRNYISDRVTNIVDSIRGIATRARNLFGDGFGWLRAQATAAKDWIGQKINEIVGFFRGLPGRIQSGIASAASGLGGALASVGASIANGIGQGFRSAWNAVARRLNNFIPNSIPISPGSVFGVSLPQVNIPLPDNPIPTFHSGGWVNARRGDEQLALLQDGEYVASRAELAGNPRADSPFGGGAGVHIDSVVVGSTNDLHLVREEFARIDFLRRHGLGRRAA